MSRARPFNTPAGQIWFDQRAKATVAQLELLADLEDIDVDDLLDEDLSQRQVLYRLRLASDDNVVPAHVIERRLERIRLAGIEPVCRICSIHGLTCEGRITRHHYVPRWMMLMLENYQAYASRSKCTIPICLKAHRDLHLRVGELASKSIAPSMTNDERKFAQKMLTEFKEQRPVVYDLILAGDESSYEYTLLRDFTLGEFAKEDNSFEIEDSIQMLKAVSEG
jgi:hypothetical protein